MAHNGAEDRLEVEGRADRLADLTQRSQLPNRLRQLSRTGLQLLKQTDVLDGDDRLVRERLKQLDLRRGEGVDFKMSCREHPSEFSVLTKRNGQVGARATERT